MKPWERVRAFCYRVGVEFRICDRPPRPCPFSTHLGIGWRSRTLYVSATHLRDPLTIGQAIHEIGHIVATREPPESADELDFTGWESAAASICGVRRWWYSLAMTEYGTDELDEFGDLDTAAQRAFIRRARARGRAIGNVSPSGRPVSLR